ncbi:hypothetical protein ACIRST_40060 [Kitasatospora sp. NPDC101447]|uniref:hypothetical protein n=1 Tax=Kitasatospora sp. NPDC101447 TaxID=3364102 RepID=UPI0038075D64
MAVDGGRGGFWAVEKMGEQGELDELRARLAALEAEVGRLREESAAAHTAAVRTGEARTAGERTAGERTAGGRTAEARTATRRGAAKREAPAAVTVTGAATDSRTAGVTTVTAKAGRDSTEAGSSAHAHTPAPDAARPDRAELHQSMTGLADALGVMRSEQAERADRALQAERAEQPTQVLRTRPLEARSSAPARHSQFLESLLAGQAVLPEEPQRESR